ncbi:TPA: hypothetical protein MB364_000837 [Klebsiella variicola subsp. variicola]|nr:hypothetical protein [Klebsiella variicola subsp. variicola]
MKKGSYLCDLNNAYLLERQSMVKRTYSPYKNLPPARWREVAQAANRQRLRKARRKAGRCNKLGVHRTALGMIRQLNYNDSLTSSPTFPLRDSGGGFPLLGDS